RNARKSCARCAGGSRSSSRTRPSPSTRAARSRRRCASRSSSTGSRPATQRGAGSPSCSSSSGCARTTPAAIRTSSPAGSASACASPARSRPIRPCSCSTSRPPLWTCRYRRRSSICCATCRPRSASPTCSSPTISASSAIWPTACSSCTPGRSSRRRRPRPCSSARCTRTRARCSTRSPSTRRRSGARGRCRWGSRTHRSTRRPAAASPAAAPGPPRNAKVRSSSPARTATISSAVSAGRADAFPNPKARRWPHDPRRRPMNDRSARVQAALEEAQLDALLVAAPSNIAYLSGFHANPHERLIALVVPRAGAPQLVCPSLEEEAARSAVPSEVVLHVWRDEDGPAQALARALSDGGGRIGIEKSYLSVANAELAAAAAPAARFDGCDALLARLRVIKSEDELASECAQQLRAGGGDGLAFDPLVLTGARAALPHGHPGPTKIADGDLLIVDIGVVVDGYAADITRTFVVGGTPDERQREIFDTVHAAERAGIEAVRAGAPARDVDVAARTVIADAGYGAAFIHRTGHGLGLETHEPPYLTSTNDE